MSVRTKVLGFVDVLMRVPPLFLIDEILKISLSFSNTVEEQLQSSNSLVKNGSAENGGASIIAEGFNTVSDEETDFYKFLSVTTIKFIICLIGKKTNKTFHPTKFIRAKVKMINHSPKF